MAGMLSDFFRRAYKDPALSRPIPSASGLEAYRQAQKELLKSFEHEHLLTQQARKLRNQILAVGVSVAMASVATGIGLGSTFSAMASAKGVTEAGPNQRLADTFQRLEEAATDLYLAGQKGVGRESPEMVDRANRVHEAAKKVGQIMGCVKSTSPDLYEKAQARLNQTASSDLGLKALQFKVDIGKVAQIAEKGRERKNTQKHYKCNFTQHN